MDVKAQGNRACLNRPAGAGGAQTIGALEHLAVPVERDAAFVDEAEPRYETISRDNPNCSRRQVVALDIDPVWTRDGLIPEPFSQSRVGGETARGGVVDDKCRMCRRHAGRLARRRAIGVRRAAIDDKALRANRKL